MRYIALLLMLLSSILSASARKDVTYWRAVPAQTKTPAFRYHLEGRNSLLHRDLQLPPDLDPNRWGVHVWMAYPAVVTARVTAIRNLLNRKERVQHLLKDKYH
jgi:hypothetical protein